MVRTHFLTGITYRNTLQNEEQNSEAKSILHHRILEGITHHNTLHNIHFLIFECVKIIERFSIVKPKRPRFQKFLSATWYDKKFKMKKNRWTLIRYKECKIYQLSDQIFTPCSLQIFTLASKSKLFYFKV